MKKPICLLTILALAGLHCSVAWAQSIYKCTGATGETLYSERPCETAIVDTARYAVHSGRLEQVNLHIVELKRELMDLDREYSYRRTRATPRTEPELTASYEQRVQSVNNELAELERLRAILVGESFAEFNQEKVE